MHEINIETSLSKSTRTQWAMRSCTMHILHSGLSPKHIKHLGGFLQTNSTFQRKKSSMLFYAKAPAAKPFDTLWQFFSVGKVITIFPFVWVLRVLPPFFVPQMLFIMAPVLSVTVLLMTWLWRRWKLCEGCWLWRLRGHCGLPGSNKLRQNLICNTDTHFLQVKTTSKLECVWQNFHEKE